MGEMKKRLKREQRFGPCEGKSKSSSRDGDRRSDRRYELDPRKSDSRRRDIMSVSTKSREVSGSIKRAMKTSDLAAYTKRDKESSVDSAISVSSFDDAPTPKRPRTVFSTAATQTKLLIKPKTTET